MAGKHFYGCMRKIKYINADFNGCPKKLPLNRFFRCFNTIQGFLLSGFIGTKSTLKDFENYINIFNELPQLFIKCVAIN